METEKLSFVFAVIDADVHTQRNSLETLAWVFMVYKINDI